MELENVQIVILGAGKGTRMKNTLPKVLIPVKGKPMIQRLVETSIKSSLTKKPVIVVSPINKKQIQETLKDTCFYAVQKKQLGTGHAVLCTKKLLENKCAYTLVLNGDHSFVTIQTLKKLVSLIKKNNAMVAMATTKVSDFNDWQKTFFDFGRIIRDKQDNITEIVEKKDATKKQLEIKEVNAAYYCFNTKWLFETLSKLKNDNSQSEYYLTDIVKLTIKGKGSVTSLQINPYEALGVNDPEQLFFAEHLQRINQYSDAIKIS